MKKLSIIILCLALFDSAKSQDFIFSQYYASQPYLNPAMTGFFDGSYRVNLHFRNQWAGIGGGINSFGVNGDMKLGENDPEKDYVALGFCAYRDQIFNRVSYMTGRFNFAYTKRLGYGDLMHYLSFGANVGMDNKSVNTNFIYVDPAQVEIPQRSNIFIPNAGLGLNYQIVFPSFANVFMGGSVDHLVTDKVSIFNSDIRTEKRITMYSSARLKVTDKLFLLPTIMAAKQGSAQQINFGVAAQMLMRNYYDTKGNIQVGVYSRLANDSYDAIVGMFRYENKGLQLGISYDHNLNELNQATGGYGAMELTIGFIGLIERDIKSRAECPNIKNF